MSLVVQISGESLNLENPRENRIVLLLQLQVKAVIYFK
jgi:hypothetical protein